MKRCVIVLGGYARWKVHAVLAVAIAGLFALSASPALGRGGTIDFGDAPDGAKAGYLTKPAVVGHFPTTLAGGGPRHDHVGALTLGPTENGEPDSHQVDRDIDDGASLDAPRACKKATLTTALRGGAPVASGGIVYVNAWFDWNRDGDWSDPSDGCAPEWAVRNMPVAASSIGSATMLPITITAGKQVVELWYRVTVTLDQVQIDPSGRGRSIPYSYGETEDYLHQRTIRRGIIIGGPPKGKKRKRKKDKFSVRCVPPVKVIAHGGSATFHFNFVDKGKGLIFAKFLGGRSTKFYKLTLLRAGNQRGVPRGFTRAFGFRYQNKQIDPPKRVQKVQIRARFQRGKFVRRALCTVIVVHVGKERIVKKKGKKKEIPPKIKPVRCAGPCGGELPAQPPAKGPTLTKYELHPDGTARLLVTPTDPLNGFTIPLFPPNPTPVDPPKVTNSGEPVKCELKALQLVGTQPIVGGGPAALKCKLDPPGPAAVDSFFDVFYEIPPLAPDSFFDIFYEVGSSTPRAISGTLDAPDGTPVEGFTAPGGPPAPAVSGSGTLSPGPNPNAVDLKVKFDVQNTTLNHFEIEVPMSQQVTSGGVAGFTCNPVNDLTKHALVCDGTVTSGQEIQGGFELAGPRPSQLASGSQLFGSSADATQFGPFDLDQMPSQPDGTGVFTPGGGANDVDFTVTLNSFGALNQFELDLPNGAQIQPGAGASNSFGSFTCNVGDKAPGTGNALQCGGKPIANGDPIQGSFTLNAAVPTNLGANSQLYSSGMSTPQFGPPATTITDGT